MDEGKAKPHKMCESAEEWIAMRMAEMKPGEPFAPDFALDPPQFQIPHGRGSDDWMDYIPDPPPDLMTSIPWWNCILCPSDDGRWAETAYWWDQMRSRPELYERFMKRRIEMVKTYCLREGITEVLEEKEVEMTEEGKKVLDALLRMSTRIGIPEEPPERYRRKD